MSVTLVTREEWEAIPCKTVEPMEHPIDKVLVTFDNSCGPCYNKDECFQAVRALQKFYILQKRIPDTPYNFVIGYDGNVYECRGWSAMSHRCLIWPEYGERTLEIAILGVDSNMEPPNLDMKNEPMKVTKKFLADLVVKKILCADYKSHIL